MEDAALVLGKCTSSIIPGVFVCICLPSTLVNCLISAMSEERVQVVLFTGGFTAW